MDIKQFNNVYYEAIQYLIIHTNQLTTASNVYRFIYQQSQRIYIRR
jgi:hypothetical protein